MAATTREDLSTLPLDATQQYLFKHASEFIQHIQTKAAKHPHAGKLFETKGKDRLVLEQENPSEVEKKLIGLLSDEIVQRRFAVQFGAWRPILTKEAIELVRSGISDYYFRPLALHSDWKTFCDDQLTKMKAFCSNNEEEAQKVFQHTIDQIVGAFSQWIINIFLQKYPQDRTKLQILIKIINNGVNLDYPLSTEFAKDLLFKITHQLQEFLTNIKANDIKVSNIAEELNLLLTSLHTAENVRRTQNGHRILLNRLFWLSSELTRETYSKEVRKQIAIGLLNYFDMCDEKFTKDEQHFMPITNTLQNLKSFLTKEEREPFSRLFELIPEPSTSKDQVKKDKDADDVRSRYQSSQNVLFRKSASQIKSTKIIRSSSAAPSTPLSHTREPSAVVKVPDSAIAGSTSPRKNGSKQKPEGQRRASAAKEPQRRASVLELWAEARKDKKPQKKPEETSTSGWSPTLSLKKSEEQ